MTSILSVEFVFNLNRSIVIPCEAEFERNNNLLKLKLRIREEGHINTKLELINLNEPKDMIALACSIVKKCKLGNEYIDSRCIYCQKQHPEIYICFGQYPNITHDCIFNTNSDFCSNTKEEAFKIPLCKICDL